MTRRTQPSTRPPRPSRTNRRRRAGAPPRRSARGQTFTPLGFAFFRLVSIHDREPGEAPYAVIRLHQAKTAMAAFVAAAA